MLKILKQQIHQIKFKGILYIHKILLLIFQKFSSASAQIETYNLEDLISSTSLMYVSGDSQGLDSTKLQLVFCKVRFYRLLHFENEPLE